MKTFWYGLILYSALFPALAQQTPTQQAPVVPTATTAAKSETVALPAEEYQALLRSEIEVLVARQNAADAAKKVALAEDAFNQLLGSTNAKHGCSGISPMGICMPLPKDPESHKKEAEKK
jgi:hypothetical protein